MSSASPTTTSTPTKRHASSFTGLRRNFVAGLTVAAVELPQAIGYALLAGVPPQYGIAASIVQGVVSALVGSAPSVVVGPTNTQSLLVISAMSRLVDPSVRPETYVQLVAALALFKGVMQIAIAALRLGDLVRFVSKSVIVGIAAGAGILIILGQLPHLLGIERAAAASVSTGLQPRLQDHAHLANPIAIFIGVGGAALLLITNRFLRQLPAALILVVLATAAVWMFDLQGKVPVVGSIAGQIPSFSLAWPGLEKAKMMLPGAAALAVLGLIETVAIAKTVSQSDVRINPNREAMAQGLANGISSFFQAIPGSASFTRSAVSRAAGTTSRSASAFAAAAVLIAFLLLAPLGKYLPNAAIAAVLIASSIGLIDLRFIFRILRTSWPDAIVCLVTLVAMLAAPLEYAVFIGIVVNIIVYLRSASMLHMHEMIPSESGPFLERPLHTRGQQDRIVFLQLEGELFFGVADELRKRLDALLNSDLKVAIIRLKRTHGIDATILDALDQFARDMQRHGKHLILCGVRESQEKLLAAYGLMRVIGKENVFPASAGIWGSAKLALARATMLASPNEASPQPQASTTNVRD